LVHGSDGARTFAGCGHHDTNTINDRQMDVQMNAGKWRRRVHSLGAEQYELHAAGTEEHHVEDVRPIAPAYYCRRLGPDRICDDAKDHRNCDGPFWLLKEFGVHTVRQGRSASSGASVSERR
jgi:hypothetical protein